MQEPSRPHPLDASDDDYDETRWSREPASPSIAYQPLLKPSLRVAAVATFAVAIGSILTATFRLGSEAYDISIAMFRISGAVLVCALVSVLVSYRIGYLRLNPQRRRRRVTLRYGGYGQLVLYNLLGLAIAWIVLLWASWEFGAGVVGVVSPLLLLAAGLLATMIVSHQGHLRAYAIGSLTTLALQYASFSNLAAMVMFNRGGVGPGFSGFDMLAISLGVTITIVICSGLLSSGYVVALTAHVRRQDDMLQGNSADRSAAPNALAQGFESRNTDT